MTGGGGTRRLVADDGAEVAGNVEVAKTVWQRFIGLMGRRELAAGDGLFISPCSSIHMFFMRFPLDVAFVDREGRVVRAYHGIRPWRATRIVSGARAAIELPAGTLAAHQVGKGSRLLLQ